MPCLLPVLSSLDATSSCHTGLLPLTQSKEHPLASDFPPWKSQADPLLLGSVSSFSMTFFTATLPIRSEVCLLCQGHYSLGSKQIFCHHKSQASQKQAIFIRY